MTTVPKSLERRALSLLIAVLGSELLLALSFLRLWGDTTSLVFRTNVIDAALAQPFWGTALSGHVVAFVASLMLIHVVLAVAAWGLGRLSRQAWPRSPNSLSTWTLLWLMLLSVWIFAANAAWFPESSLGNPYAGAISLAWHDITLFHGLTAMLGAGLALTLARAGHRWLQVPPRPSRRMTSSLAAAATLAMLASFAITGRDSRATPHARPHVILIGLDSLRPDALHGLGGQTLTPALDEFLAQSTVFSDTLTPLARTFPAWVSIVSGKHPHTTGAINNLLPRDLIHEGDTLPKLLGRSGYRTVYATDEVRFSNLDATYGFDRVVAPPMGAADFLLGFFTDSPFANLLINTPAGEWLFPYAYANRAQSVTYDPDTFIARLDRQLSFDEPTLLAVHLTLVHWPYTWAGAPVAPEGAAEPGFGELYRNAVARVDRQFDDLVDVLRAKGALDNALVVVLSDHGEALGEPIAIADDARARRHIRSLILGFGHGTNVFAESQYRVVLGVRSFGATGLETKPGTSLTMPASLEDIAPTLADALGLTPDEPFDGISWLPQLRGSPAEGHDGRVRYLETEFVPPGFEAGTFLSTSVLNSASGFYHVDPETDRVLIRLERVADLLESRQYAATQAGRLLAAVPSDDKKRQHVVYLETPEATPKWFDAAPSPEDPAYDLWTALHARFALVQERPIEAPLGGE